MVNQAASEQPTQSTGRLTEDNRNVTRQVLTHLTPFLAWMFAEARPRGVKTSIRGHLK